ncbi:MAG: cysteine desulfurase family protein [Planctomycetota bacterium]|jgi:cysteine desulfurase
MRNPIIYMDHAATTPTDGRVLEAMKPYFTERFTNPATLYGPGRENDKAIEAARGSVAARLGARPEEICFTSGGTESDNWAVKGVALANEKKGRHIITSTIEHHAVLEPCEYLAKRGWELTVLPVSEKGLVDPGDVKKALRDDTVLVSIMHANNEIGTIEPVAEIAGIARDRGVAFHTDAVQTVGKIPVEVEELGVDLLSASGHKFYGPKGVGFLYIRKGTKIEAFNQGGGQEGGRRSGTLNVPGIVGLAKALELSEETIGAAERLSGLTRRLWSGLVGSTPDMRLNTDLDNSLPGFLNFVVEGVEGEAMLLRLDGKGICVSSGSACTTGSLEPSHVLLALGLPPEVAHGSLRFTFGRENTDEEIDGVLGVLPGVIATLREMSPTYHKH